MTGPYRTGVGTPPDRGRRDWLGWAAAAWVTLVVAGVHVGAWVLALSTMRSDAWAALVVVHGLSAAAAGVWLHERSDR